MNNVEALKALYVALGGNLTDTYEGIADGISVSDYNLSADVISAISQLEIGGGGGSTSTPFVVTLSGTSDNYSTDKNYSQIKAAASEGKKVILNVGSTGLPVNNMELNNYDNMRAVFFGVEELYTYTISITSGNSVSVTTGTIPE